MLTCKPILSRIALLLPMGMIKCPECGNSVSDTANSCPNCGYDFKGKNEEKQGMIGCLAIIVFFVFCVFCCNGEDSSESESGESSEFVSKESSSTAHIERAIKNHYNDFSKLISLEELPETSDYDYRFTIEEKIDAGMTCKQKGFVKCYSDGTVSNITNYGGPFDFRDNKGNEVHDPTGNSLY